MKQFMLIVGVTALAGLTALHSAGRRKHAPQLEGEWLMTIAVPGVRPVPTVITFLSDTSSQRDTPDRGSWRKIADNRFEIAFLTRVDGGIEWRASGTLKLDEFDRLRGELRIEFLDASQR